MKNKLGFHLIEILITLSIIGILLLVVIPTYSQYYVRIYRIEAENILVKLATAMEAYHFENNTYIDASLARLKFPEIIAHQYYQLCILQTTDADFQIAAKPLGIQAARDKKCNILFLNANGKKSNSGSGKVEECW